MEQPSQPAIARLPILPLGRRDFQPMVAGTGSLIAFQGALDPMTHDGAGPEPS